jgi:hypothetical protein
LEKRLHQNNKSVYGYLNIVNNNLGFQGILNSYQVMIVNFNLTKLGYIRKFRPKRFHQINPRPFRQLHRNDHAEAGQQAATNKDAIQVRAVNTRDLGPML